MSINEYSAEIVFLSYDKLFIVLDIPYSEFNKLSFEAKATVSFNFLGKNKKVEAKIINFGYEVIDDSVEVIVE